MVIIVRMAILQVLIRAIAGINDSIEIGRRLFVTIITIT